MTPVPRLAGVSRSLPHTRATLAGERGAAWSPRSRHGFARPPEDRGGYRAEGRCQWSPGEQARQSAPRGCSASHTFRGSWLSPLRWCRPPACFLNVRREGRTSCPAPAAGRPPPTPRNFRLTRNLLFN